MKGGQNQQLVPGSVNTKQARNKKHLANPALQQIELQSCVIFSGVNIEDSFRKALFFDIPVKKVSAQFQNTPRTPH
jgi:hypothetical protein